MAWKKNKKLVSERYADLKCLPRERCGWDCALTCLAFWGEDDPG